MTDDRVALPIGPGTVAGVCAWLAGYLVTYVNGIDAVRADVRTQILGFFVDDPATWKIVGWLYYNAHGVDVLIPRIGFVGPARPNYVLTDEGTVRLLFLLPPLALLLAGLAVGWWRRADVDRAVDGVLVGSTVAAGYLPVTVIGLFAFTLEVGGDVIRPHPVTAVLFAGLLYPLVFGGVGGLVGYVAGGSSTGGAE